MTDLSTVKEEQIVLVDKDTAIRYKVIEEKIDLEALRREREAIEQILATPKPTDKELIELGKSYHNYYLDKTSLLKRLGEIEGLGG